MFLTQPVFPFRSYRWLAKLACVAIFSLELLVLGSHAAVSAEPLSADPDSVEGKTVEGNSAALQIAVVDMNSAAKQLGKVEEVIEQLRARHSVLKERLQGLQESYLEEYRQAEAIYGEGRTIEQTQRLAALQQKLKTEWENALKVSGEDIETFKTELIADFRKEIGNVAMIVAKEEGFFVVFDSGNHAVLAFSDQVDLTTKVVERYRQMQSENENEITATEKAVSFEELVEDSLQKDGDDQPKSTEPK